MAVNPVDLATFKGQGRRVLVVQRRLPHYRVAFFEALARRLAEHDLVFQLAHGLGTPEEELKKDRGHLDGALDAPNRYLWGGRICWQPFGRFLPGADIAIFTPENKLLYNLIPQFFERRVRLGFWGHGANFQGDIDSLKERYKRLIARQIDWWFAYTAVSVPFVRASGFPQERITVLNNSVDTVQMAAMRERFRPEGAQALYRAQGLQGRHVGVYVGSLYEDKRIDFLLEAALAIRQRVPDFELLIVGAGVLQPMVEDFCARHGWARFLGMLKGQAKVDAVCSGSVLLNPGLVGLGILDAFVCRTPLVTTDCRIHSPEIAYLDNGVNGMMTENTVPAFADACAGLLTSEPALDRLREGCARSAAHYTVENMAGNFLQGVASCLESPLYR